MASSGDKGFKQDMVVSIRYRNDLPPPPMPPKFLNIDTGGIAQYLTTSYASSLARREEPNIEVDAEGGMPIDMIGVPGYFLGDESAIMAPEIIPVLEPADQALMLNLDQLKSQGAKNNVSFLRKTQYMTSQNARANDPLIRPNPRTRKSIDNKTAPPAYAREDKENIKRHVQKSFDIACPDSIPYNPPEAKGQPSTPAERDAWRNPVHPTNSRLNAISYYPVLPDLEAVTDIEAGWYRVKFDKPPLPAIRNKRDDRTDVALFTTLASEKRPAWLARKEAFESNPAQYEDPGPEPYTWSMHVPKYAEFVPKIRNILNDANPDKDDPALQEDLLEESVDNQMRIPFPRARVYPSVTQTPVDPQRFMAISLVDADSTPSTSSRVRKQGQAAYYYGIMDNVRLKADRGKLDKAPNGAAGADEDIPDNLADSIMLLPREPTAQETLGRMQFRAAFDSGYANEFRKVQDAAAAEEATERVANWQGTTEEGENGDVDMEGPQDGEKDHELGYAAMEKSAEMSDALGEDDADAMDGD